MLFQINSERLSLLALSEKELLILSQKGRNAQELGLTLSNFELNADISFLEEFGRVLASYVIPNVQKNPENYLWFTHWLIVENSSQTTIGGIGIGGMPNLQQETMIGYFVDKKFENQGVATEAVQMLTGWMFENKHLKSIVADTLLEGIGSQKVLQKAGFIYLQKVEEGLRWQLKKYL